MTVKEIMKRGSENTAEDLTKALAALATLRTKQKEAMRAGNKKELASLRNRIRKREQEIAALRLFVAVPGTVYPDNVEVREHE